MQKDLHAKFMQLALVLARRGAGKTSPNPMVGCVIVKSGGVIAEGWHRRYGGDHAEVDALKKAGVRAKGATMYVTLEPCSHWGQTPPCVQAVLAAGIKRVVVAMRDPNPVNNGKSLRILKRRGVDVVEGICENESRSLNSVFVKYMTRNMPYVVGKSAQTIDGKTSTHLGHSPWITSETTRVWAKKKRDLFDAILVGVNTIVADDPILSAPKKRLKKIIVDSRLRAPLTAKIFKVTPPQDVIVVTTIKGAARKRKALELLGVTVLVSPDKAGRVDLKCLFKELAKRKITSILLEGGSTVLGAALKAKLVDRLHVYIAPTLMSGGHHKNAATGIDVRRAVKDLKFKIRDIQRIGPDVFIDLCSPGS